MLTCYIIMLTCNMKNMLHVNISMLCFHINSLHVNINTTHVDLIYLACTGQKYSTVILYIYPIHHLSLSKAICLDELMYWISVKNPRKWLCHLQCIHPLYYWPQICKGMYIYCISLYGTKMLPQVHVTMYYYVHVWRICMLYVLDSMHWHAQNMKFYILWWHTIIFPYMQDNLCQHTT